ncbi:c-type cytochrome [Palleronia sp. LCG004]|uniref:cytochrome c oxidase subunit II n=1 Tax=Palleronia sp. LCG004 TaxID=3079304 RepID=UPI002941CF84|nr:c-type cytochrome [Palleronia sp. LCG004]WOI55265.1 c-type cytochrome [Palleronia sp. LCG004]
MIARPASLVLWTGLFILALAACDGPQSALSPGGRDAEVLAGLLWVMLAGAVAIWFLINGLFFFLTRIRPTPMSRRKAEMLIIGGGILFPTVVVGGLLTYGLSIMPDQRAPGQGTRMEVVGEQWWWRVHYWPEGADTPIVSANEIRFPVGTRSEITLEAARVIHSLWIPGLGGKTDMIPGRTNRMSLEPLDVGTYRGQCAEFCGDSHALMALNAVVMPRESFDAWLGRISRPAAPPEGALEREGQRVFFSEGCGACHAVRGTQAAGRLGPDLTHLAGRTSLAAGIMELTGDNLARWIRDPDEVKPGARMPAYDHLSEAEMSALVAYLEGLE